MKRYCAITTIESTLESFVIPSMRRMKEEGWDVTLIASLSDAFISRYGDEFHCISVPMKRGIAIKELFVKPFAFYKIFKRERFDCVQYATTNASFYASLPAWLLGIKTRIYCQWGLLYPSYTGLLRLLYKMIEKFLCSLATDVTVASKKNMQLAIEEGLIGPAKASVVGDGGTVGVDLAEFNISLRPVFRAQVEAEYPLLKGKVVFGFVGRIEVDKGVAELLEAFLSLGMEDAALLLIGDFDALRSGFEPHLMARARACQNIIFHGFTREVPKYLSAVDILVHPTYREGFSMVIQQAMAMGCAIVTTDIPGPSEVIVEGESGLLVPARSAASLAEAMSLLAKDEERRRSMTDKALTRVKSLFNRERMVELTYQDRMRMIEKNTRR